MCLLLLRDHGDISCISCTNYKNVDAIIIDEKAHLNLPPNLSQRQDLVDQMQWKLVSTLPN